MKTPVDYFLGLGARPGRSFKAGGRAYDYELDTPAGLLHVSVYPDWVATCFEDLERGTAFTNGDSNKYTGKWNFHPNPEGLPENLEEMVTYWIDRLMRWTG